MWKQLTGEPVAGELHSGFGGRGRLLPFPTPIRWPVNDGQPKSSSRPLAAVGGFQLSGSCAAEAAVQPLAALATSHPSLIRAQTWHSQVDHAAKAIVARPSAPPRRMVALVGPVSQIIPTPPCHQRKSASAWSSCISIRPPASCLVAASPVGRCLSQTSFTSPQMVHASHSSWSRSSTATTKRPSGNPSAPRTPAIHFFDGIAPADAAAFRMAFRNADIAL